MHIMIIHAFLFLYYVIYVNVNRVHITAMANSTGATKAGFIGIWTKRAYENTCRYDYTTI